MLKGKCVLITGAAGTIGKALSFHVINQQARKVILLDSSETPLYELEQEIVLNFKTFLHVEYILADITNLSSIAAVFKRVKPEVVFHSAAYKHVPVLEKNPHSAVFNNILGTKILADYSVEYNAEKFIYISTDKAINPSSVMGASKLIGEKYLLALSNESLSKTNFIINRFGNILESNGSVIPLFKRQIKSNRLVTITDKKATRFFMSISQAIELIHQSLKLGKGGDIFVFDMGEAKSIYELAIETIISEGYIPYKNVEVKFIGLRPGEKLHETLLSDKMSILATEHPKIFKTKFNKRMDLVEINEQISLLCDLSRKDVANRVVEQMKKIVPEFKSMNSTFEKLD